ncbi:MAG: ABC transporter ATP-binding protein [Chloroflexi bacterium]|nr:ABC transporter ATP-binding protein [Chloroflexota bacterium]
MAEGLTRHFGDHLAVNQLDLQVASGEVFGFLGPNGAGKTTTVRLLNGVLSADGGSARVLGYDVATDALEIRRRTGVLTETPSLYEALTARENLLFFGDLYGLPESELPRRAGALLEEFGLADRADDRVGTYSKGMRQRLAIARALLHSPELIFLDEPTSGLDPAAARMVRETIQTLSQVEGRTVFLCTHNLAEAQLLCSRVGVIDHGVLQAVGTPQELASSLWQELTVEIDLRGEPSAAVREALSRLPEVSGQSMENDRLVLTLANEDAIPTVVAAIAANGGRIYGVIPREHTLEEIYFRIQANSHGEKGGAA